MRRLLPPYSPSEETVSDIRIVSCPNGEFHSPDHDHLWVLAGGGDFFDGGLAVHLGPDRDIEGDDLAGRRTADVVGRLRELGYRVDAADVREALADYRRARAVQGRR